MIERIARAIYDELEGPVNNQDFSRQVRQWDEAKKLAIAAVIAMREPTSKMVRAGQVGPTIMTWKAMIDSILIESSQPQEEKVK